MKQIITVFVFFLFSLHSIAQKEQDFALNSLKFLDSTFYLHLQKENELVLIDINNNKYITYQFVDKDSLEEITRLRLMYILKPLETNKYEFIIKSATKDAGSYDYKGSFEFIENNNNYQFLNLEYIKRDE